VGAAYLQQPQIYRPTGLDGASGLPVLQICRPYATNMPPLCYKYAAPTGLDGASGLPVLQICRPYGAWRGFGLPVLQICRPYGAWIGASPKSVIICQQPINANFRITSIFLLPLTERAWAGLRLSVLKSPSSHLWSVSKLSDSYQKNCIGAKESLNSGSAATC